MKCLLKFPLHHGVVAAVLAANLLANTNAQAALTYSTVNSLSVDSTLSGSPGDWRITLREQAITDSRSVDSRTWTGSSRPTGTGFSSLRFNTMGISQPSGPIDFVNIAHDSGSVITSWNSSGSISVSFDRPILFYFSPGTGNTWSFAGASIVQGTRFDAGTYTFGFASIFSVPGGIREWTTTAYFEAVSVPAPGAFALLGAASLLGCRRRLT